MSCCDTTVVAPDEGNCTSCGIRGVQVPVITAKALMTGAALRRGVPQAPRFCAAAECSVVYFDDVSPRRVGEDELVVPVYAKHPGQSTVPVCYCFGYTVGMVQSARRTESTLVSHVVRAEVEAGHCACEVKNPRGTCCLGDIARIERALEGNRDGETKTG